MKTDPREGSLLAQHPLAGSKTGVCQQRGADTRAYLARAAVSRDAKQSVFVAQPALGFASRLTALHALALTASNAVRHPDRIRL